MIADVSTILECAAAITITSLARDMYARPACRLAPTYGLEWKDT
jgi:hypothetical protein